MSSSHPPPRVPPPPSSGTQPPPSPLPGHAAPEGSKSFIVTLLLSYFLGIFGADRFYLGKNRSARLKLVTLGGFGYWFVIDLFMTLFGAQRDAWGLRLAGYDKHKRTVWGIIGALFGSAMLFNIVAATIMAASGSEGPTTFGWVLLAMLAAAAAVGGRIWFLRRRARGDQTAARLAERAPLRIRTRIAKLMALRHLYLVRTAAGDSDALMVIGQVDSVVANVTDLFRRLSFKAHKEQRRLAQAEYEDKLDTLVAALGRDYLLDMLANPGLWDNPERRIRNVHGAIDAVNAQLLHNIRQINARRGLVFQVALDDLMGPRKAMDDWQRDFDKLSGAE